MRSIKDGTDHPYVPLDPFLLNLNENQTLHYQSRQFLVKIRFNHENRNRYWVVSLDDRGYIIAFHKASFFLKIIISTCTFLNIIEQNYYT